MYFIGWMFDIVANKTNSLDVDKLDYLHRDAKSLGLKGSVGFETERIIKNARVIGNRLAYNSKMYYEIEQVFFSRYKLFKECYSHRVCRAIDYMIVDALLAANGKFHFEKMILDPSLYVNCTDNILGLIENSSSPDLADSRKILKRIRTRDLYRFLTQKIIVDKELC